jgi:hypothetical protein
MAGRPTKEPGEKMDVPLRIMLTPTQDKIIRQAAEQAGADVSAWARPLLLDAAGVKWIAVSVDGREALVQLMRTEDKQWHISKYDCPSPSSRMRQKRIAQTLFVTVPSLPKAAEHVAGLIRNGVISPGEGRSSGRNLARFDFPE